MAFRENYQQSANMIFFFLLARSRWIPKCVTHCRKGLAISKQSTFPPGSLCKHVLFCLTFSITIRLQKVHSKPVSPWQKSTFDSAQDKPANPPFTKAYSIKFQPLQSSDNILSFPQGPSREHTHVTKTISGLVQTFLLLCMAPFLLLFKPMLP